MRIFTFAFFLLCLAGTGAAVAASTEADFKAALAAAQAAEQDAGKLKNQWSTTDRLWQRRRKPRPPAILTTP